jgi:hypothetical protein
MDGERTRGWVDRLGHNLARDAGILSLWQTLAIIGFVANLVMFMGCGGMMAVIWPLTDRGDDTVFAGVLCIGAGVLNAAALLRGRMGAGWAAAVRVAATGVDVVVTGILGWAVASSGSGDVVQQIMLLFAGAALVVAAVQAPVRAFAGRCDRCGYDLTGNVSGACPECGNLMDEPLGGGDPPS